MWLHYQGSYLWINWVPPLIIISREMQSILQDMQCMLDNVERLTGYYTL
jgi:hypothetical protein